MAVYLQISFMISKLATDRAFTQKEGFFLSRQKNIEGLFFLSRQKKPFFYVYVFFRSRQKQPFFYVYDFFYLDRKTFLLRVCLFYLDRKHLPSTFFLSRQKNLPSMSFLFYLDRKTFLLCVSSVFMSVYLQISFMISRLATDRAFFSTIKTFKHKPTCALEQILISIWFYNKNHYSVRVLLAFNMICCFFVQV